MTATNPPVIEFRGVTKRFGAVVAVAQMDLAIRSGEFLSFLGPSGCGKTTSLRLLAGFEPPDDGDVLLDGAVVNGLPAYRRPVNMVFQHYALFPHLNVADNVAYGLRQRTPRPSRAVIAERVAETLSLVRLDGYERRRSWELSGGQQQRVALARALINQPKVLLLDEPLAALDRKLRREMQIELQSLQRSLGITFVLVTHDQEEALSMSDRVCIMEQGRIVQVGAPRKLYDEPTNRYVADFVGKSNFFSGVVAEQANGTIAVRLNTGSTLSARPSPGAAALRPGAPVSVSVRPERILAARQAAALPDGTAVHGDGQVLNRIFLGEHTEYLVRSAALGEFLVLLPRQTELGEAPFEIGDTLTVGWRPEAALALSET